MFFPEIYKMGQFNWFRASGSAFHELTMNSRHVNETSPSINKRKIIGYGHLCLRVLGLLCLTPLFTIFQLYHGG